MDVQSIIWYTCFVLGVFFFIFGIVYLFRKRYVREDHFIKAAVFEFVASWILYIPEELFNDIPDSIPVLKEIESIFTALLRTFNIYLGNDYSRITFEGHPVFSSLYAVLITVVNIIMLLFVAGFIMKFLDGPVQNLKISFRKRRYTYIFPVYNEKTLAIAESIKKQKINLIFLSADGNKASSDKQKIAELGGIYAGGPAIGIINRVGRKSEGIEVFLFGDTEESNLIELKNICTGIEAGVKAPVKVYVELSDTPWDMYDSFLDKYSGSDNKKLVINFIRTEENFAYNNLLKNSIFENAIQKNDYKEIKILIIGMNERNLEMLKAVLHLGQMPGFRLTVMVLDEGSGRSMLKAKMPDIYDECNKEGDAIYRLIYKENVGLESLKTVEEEYPDFTFAFVNAGDDLKNVNIAMQLNGMNIRLGRKDSYKIQVNVQKQKICIDWNKAITENLDLVGDLKTTYGYDLITMSDIEKGTIAIHEVRHPKGTPGYRSWVSYCNNEYNRHSVYARTLSFKYKVKLIHDLYDPKDELKGTDGEWDIYKIAGKDRKWKIYEHMRWNMYTRTQGFISADKKLLDGSGEPAIKIRLVAKVQNDLVDYSELSKEEQDKDALELTPDIVKILRGI